MPVLTQYQIKSWTTDDGLPQNTVHSIVQTRDGYLWLTTLDGLVRYDGVRFQIFNKNNSPGILSNRFTQIVEDGAGNLWVGTEESGVTRYHNGGFQTYAVAGRAQSKPLWRMTLNAEGRLVVPTEAGIVEWNGNEFVAALPIAGETKDSQIFWSKSGAFYYINGQILHRFVNGRASEFELPGTEQPTVRYPFFEDRRGRLWIGTKTAGLIRLEDDRLTVLTENDGLPKGLIIPRIEDREGNLWATSDYGAASISTDGKVNKTIAEAGLSDGILTSIYEDREGNVWLGTLFRGLNRLSRNSVAFYSTDDGLAANVVHPIFQDNAGDVWLGGGGLTRWRNNQFNRFAGDEKPLSNVVTAVAQDRAGRLWFGHWNGAYYLENGKFNNFTERLSQQPAITDIHEDANGALWFASNNGLFRYQNDVITHLTTAENLVSNNVKVIHESPDGTLWFGAYGGLSRLRDNQFQSLTVADGLASNQVRSLYEDADGVLWIGSYDGGLTRLKDGKLTVYTSKNGLFNDGVFQILEDASSNLWMCSNRGVYRVSKQQLNDFADGRIVRIESIAYGKADGLLETECNGGQQPAGIKARDGKLWFPTQGGVAVIDPDKIETNPFAPPILIESIALNGVAAPVPDEVLEISPDVENVEITYTGLSFIKPEQVRFRYRMSGLDSVWVEADTRRAAYYSHLPAGNYDFTVIAANSDGVWNETGANLKVRVVPPFYRTFWFIALSIVGLFVVVVVFYQRRVENVERARRTQENFARQLIESQEQERSRIAGELHDGLSQSLVIIKNRADLSLATPDDAERAFEQMEEISAAASEAMFEAKEIIYDLRPIQLDRFGLTKAIKAMLKRVGDAHGIELRADVDEINGLLDQPAESNLYRIAQELINNVVRHSRARTADVSIKRTGDFIRLEIADDGVGFSAEKTLHDEYHKGGFGLLGVVERARLLNGTAEIQSAEGDGTTVIIALPIK